MSLWQPKNLQNLQNNLTQLDKANSMETWPTQSMIAQPFLIMLVIITVRPSNFREKIVIILEINIH